MDMYVISTAQDLSGTLRCDVSMNEFVQELSRSDLVARKLVDKNQMFDRFAESILENPNPGMRSRLLRAIEYCERVLMRCSFIQGELQTTRFCITKGNTLEDGMPFTIGNIIFLPESFVQQESDFSRLCAILIHELTHIIQRRRRKSIDKFIVEKWGFESISEFEFRQLISANNPVRTNPDTVGTFFSKNGRVPVYIYNSTTPMNLRDGHIASVSMYDGSKNTAQYEHPYEMMAYWMYTVLTEGEENHENDGPMYKELCKYILQRTCVSSSVR